MTKVPRSIALVLALPLLAPETEAGDPAAASEAADPVLASEAPAGELLWQFDTGG